MKRVFKVVGVVVALIIAGAVAVVTFKAFTITEPFIVEPVTELAPPKGAKPGHEIKADTRTLSVFSSNLVVVVADPGASFQYDVLWLVEKPREDGSGMLMEYRCELPKHAVAEHINGIGSKLPPEILEAANGNRWR